SRTRAGAEAGELPVRGPRQARLLRLAWWAPEGRSRTEPGAAGEAMRSDLICSQSLTHSITLGTDHQGRKYEAASRPVHATGCVAVCVKRSPGFARRAISGFQRTGQAPGISTRPLKRKRLRLLTGDLVTFGPSESGQGSNPCVMGLDLHDIA